MTVVEVEMPKLAALNGQIGFPVALYEAYDDMVAYLAKTSTGVSIEQLVAQIASPDVKGTYQGLVHPRKLPCHNQRHSGQARLPGRDQHPPAHAEEALSRYIRQTKLDALVFPTVPTVAIASNPTRRASPTSCCSSRTPIPAAMPASPASSFRSRSVRRASSLSVSNSMDRPKAIANCSRSAWRWRSCWPASRSLTLGAAVLRTIRS